MDGGHHIMRKVPRDSAVTLSGEALSQDGLFFERFMANRLCDVLDIQKIPHNYPRLDGGIISASATAVLADPLAMTLNQMTIPNLKLLIDRVKPLLPPGSPPLLKKGKKAVIIDRLLNEHPGPRLLVEADLAAAGSQQRAAPDMATAIRAVRLPRGALLKLKVTANAKHRAARRKYDKRYSTDIMLLRHGDASGKLFSASIAEKEITKNKLAGKSEFCRGELQAKQLLFPMLEDELWTLLVQCRVAEQEVKPPPAAPRQQTADNTNWTEREMPLTTVLDPGLQSAEGRKFQLATRMAAAVRSRLNRGGLIVPTYRDEQRPPMPAQFSFRTFCDPSSVAGVSESKIGHAAMDTASESEAPDEGVSESEAPEDEEVVDDCYYGDQAEEDQFQPEESSDSGTDPDYETEDSDEA